MERREIFSRIVQLGAAWPWQNVSKSAQETGDPKAIALDPVTRLEIYAEKAEILNKDGSPALSLNGLVLIPSLVVDDAALEVEMYVEEDCCPGILFRALDQRNFELAYAAPHNSEQANVIQYDPVFMGSNTWQIYSGSNYQTKAKIQKRQWFRFRIDMIGDRAFIQLGDNPPLCLEKLAHGRMAGRIGLWTYGPAFFRNLRMLSPRIIDHPRNEVPLPQGTVMEWGLEGYGAVFCEPNGVLNINRYLPATQGVARLKRRFEVKRETEMEMNFGFSDELLMTLNEEICFSGTHLFKGFQNIQDQGSVLQEANRITKKLKKGFYQVCAQLKVSEPFGWGISLRVQGENIEWLPATTP